MHNIWEREEVGVLGSSPDAFQRDVAKYQQASFPAESVSLSTAHVAHVCSSILNLFGFPGAK